MSRDRRDTLLLSPQSWALEYLIKLCRHNGDVGEQNSRQSHQGTPLNGNGWPRPAPAWNQSFWRWLNCGV